MSMQLTALQPVDLYHVGVNNNPEWQITKPPGFQRFRRKSYLFRVRG